MHVPYRRCDEIAGYSYRAEMLCPACTIEALIDQVAADERCGACRQDL